MRPENISQKSGTSRIILQNLGWAKACTLILLACLMVSYGAMSASAQGGFNTKGRFAILMDAETQAILYQKKANELMQPASMSKLMTLAVIFKALKEGQLKFEDDFHVSVNAWRNGGAPSRTAAMFAPLNTRITLSNLLQGIIVQSGNDACMILAEGVAGSEDAFAQMMTTEARRIGLKKSTFGNSTGLPHPKQLMTVKEIAQLSRYIIYNYPDYYKYFAQREFRYRKHRFFNRNPLIYMKIGADGLKTGYTNAAGYGLAGSAVKDGRRLIAVVSGLKSKAERKKEGRRLLEWGFNSFRQFKLFDAGQIVGSARVWGGDAFSVDLTGDGDVKVFLQRYSSKKKVKAWIVYNGPLKAPIAKGDQVATLRVVSDGNAVNEIPLYAATHVERAGVIGRGFDSIVDLAFGWFL